MTHAGVCVCLLVYTHQFLLTECSVEALTATDNGAPGVNMGNGRT